MNTDAETLVNVLRARMESMSDDERKELIDSLLEGYCKHCCSIDEPCYCWNNE